MQQYRVNYSLLVGLIIGTLVCSGAVYGLWKFQIERKSGWLIREAEKAREEKDFKQAAEFYEKYLSIHPEDTDARIKYANTYIDLTEQDEVNYDDFSMAWHVVETALRRSDLVNLPEGKELRRRLVRMYGRDTIRLYAPALDHINLLLASEPNDTELQVLRASYLARSGNVDDALKHSYKLIGYDPKSDSFDAKKAIAPHSIDIYADLAAVLRGKANKPELAEKVANQLVDANPKSAEAYVNRGRLRAAWRDIDGARADAQEAYRLKPDDVDVLLFISDVAAQDKEYDKARDYMAKAKKLHPKESRIYQRAAGLEMQQNKLDKAIAQLDEGAKNVTGAAAFNLLFVKARLQVDSGDVKGARQTVEDMQKGRKLPAEVIEYFDASMMVAQGKWFAAKEALEKLRPRMGAFGRDIITEIDYNLALCYERLGQPEMAQQQYEQIAQQNPQNAPALAGIQRMKLQRGIDSGGDKSSDPLQKAINEELKKPKAQQDWRGIEAMIDDVAKKRSLDETTLRLLKAQVALIREDYDGAAKFLIEADKLSPKNPQINRMKVQLALRDPKIGPDKALGYLQKVVDQFGDLPSLRLDKADILISQYKDKEDKGPLKSQLAGLLTGIDSWTTQQKVELWGGMAARYISLNMIDEARQYLTLAADNQPNELPLRIGLFSLALEAGDEEGMKAAQDKILKIVGNQNDSAWLYTEARRRLWLLRRQQLGSESLKEIRQLVKRALDERPDWQELHALLGEVEVMSNNAALAIKHYDRAEELGRPAPGIVAQHIRLLAAVGRYSDAGKLIDRIPEVSRQTLLGPLYAEILFRTDQVDAAIKQARTAAEADPNSAQNHYWYSQLLARSAQDEKVTDAQRTEIMKKAIASMQRAAQLQPELPEAWFALINYYLIQKDEKSAQKAMRDAQLVLSADALPMFLARSNEVLQRWFDAETMYRELYEIKPDDLQRAQQLAAFYLGPLYPRPDRNHKATPLINQILRAGAEGKLQPNDNNLLWARRKAARMLADTGDYQNLLKAEKLLASNSQDGSLLIEDKLAMADILAARPEPISRKKAIALLEEVSRVQQLTEMGAFALAELYYATSGDTSTFTTQMEKSIARFPNSARLRESYIRKLLARNDERSLEKALKYFNELRRIAPTYPATFELSVRLAIKLDKQQQARADLLRNLPDLKNVKELDERTKQAMLMFANLLVELKDLDSAEKIYRDLVQRDPKQVFNLARFLGMHRSPEQCFEKLSEVYNRDNVSEILTVAMSVARERRDKIGDKFDAQIQSWLDAGLRENPDSIPLKIVQADLFDLQKRYDDAAKVYNELRGRSDLTGVRRAVVLNNLAYLIALAGKSASTDVDPAKLVEEATQILGPNSDILDTRAVVRISREQYLPAIRDLELSVTDGPTPSKYFHKAVAHLRAGQNRAAIEAWQKAEGMGLNRDALNRMEHDLYAQVKSEIAKLRGAAVTQAETRKAG